jgi:hypothetical protein
MHGDSLRVFENTLSTLNRPTKRKPHTNNRSHQRPPSISSPSPSDALTSAHTPTPSNTPPPHTTHHNTQNYAPPTNNAATPQKPSPHETHTPTPHKTHSTTTLITLLVIRPIRNHNLRRRIPTQHLLQHHTRPTRVDTSAHQTHTPSTPPCESTTRCRLRPFTFLPPSYPRAPPLRWTAHADCPPLCAWAPLCPPAPAPCRPARRGSGQAHLAFATAESGRRRSSTGAGRWADCATGSLL